MKLRKFLVLILSFSIIVSNFIVVNAATNLMANPSFETATGYQSYGKSAVSLATSPVRTGANALKVQQTENLDGVTIDAPLQKGKTYDYEAYVKLDASAVMATTISIATIGKNADSTDHTRLISTSVSLTGSTAYTKISGSLTFYEYTSTNAKILIYANSANNIFYVDDIVLTEKANAPVITSTTPNTGVTNVNPIDLQIMASFDTIMDKATLASANVSISGKLADGTTDINSDVKKSVLCAVSNPTSVTITLFRYRLPYGSTPVVKFTGLKSATGVAMSDFYINFKVTTTFPAPYVNHLSNPGYEDITQYTHIMPGSVYDPSYPHSGTYALKVTTTADWGTTMLPAFYQLGKSYYYSAWVRLDPSTPQADTRIAINMNYAKSGGTSNNTRFAKDALNNDLNFNTSTPYTQIKGVFTPIDVPLGATTYNMKFDVTAVNGGVLTAGGRTFLVDDVEFYEIENLKVISTTPTNGQIDVLKTNRIIALNFNNELDGSTLNGNIKINDSTTLIQSVEVNSLDKKQAIITLNTNLDYSTDYNVSVANVKDIYPTTITSTNFTFKSVPKYKISDCLLLDSSQTTITKLKAGNLNVSVNTIQNSLDTDLAFTLVACLYKDGYMQDIDFKTISVPTNSINTVGVLVPMTIPTLDDGNYQLRVFIIDRLDGLQTYGDSSIIYSE